MFYSVCLRHIMFYRVVGRPHKGRPFSFSFNSFSSPSPKHRGGVILIFKKFKTFKKIKKVHPCEEEEQGGEEVWGRQTFVWPPDSSRPLFQSARLIQSLARKTCRQTDSQTDRRSAGSDNVWFENRTWPHRKACRQSDSQTDRQSAGSENVWFENKTWPHRNTCMQSDSQTDRRSAGSENVWFENRTWPHKKACRQSDSQ